LAGIKEDMKVILIGYRATGKSTVGALLSAKLKIPFGDTDTLVEENMKMSIKEIVALHGWDFFRAKEKEVVLTLAQEGASVIATGGGIVLDKENVDLLSQAGVIIWLNAPLRDIISRLNNNTPGAAVRPQFTDWNIVQETIDTMKQRIPLYEKAADHTVDTADKSAADVVTEIYKYLRKSENLAKINKSKN
jgi:shikimate kinase